MSQLRPIISPLALFCTRQVTVSLPWFVQATEYNPALATFKPLVNGEETFGAVYDAIAAARKSVDILCWGFQPSMYFKRGPGNKSLSIGELLVRKGAEGVKVRLLCWADDLPLAAWSENMAPGDNLATVIKPHMPDALFSSGSPVQRDYQTTAQLEFDRQWYAIANLNNARSDLQGKIARQQAQVRSLWSEQSTAGFRNIEMATRGFDLLDRYEIAYRTRLYGKDIQRSSGDKNQQSLIMALEPTHHQKTVLIDYEMPEHSLGFVMGHNMLDAYWDKDSHSAVRMHPRVGRNGLTPRQDISSRVSGPVLAGLNHNFCQAWDKATGQNLEKQREPIRKQIELRDKFDTRTMAQLLRTQSQIDIGEMVKKGRWHEAKQDIEAMYMQALNNATKYIYIENQYFRFPPLVEKIKAAVQRQVLCGRDPGKHGPIHLFVVTNDNDEGMGPGTVNTYRMLNALGRANFIPAVAELERKDEKKAELEKQYEAAVIEERQAQQEIVNAYRLTDNIRVAELKPEMKAAKEKQARAKAKQVELRKQMEEPVGAILPQEIPGLKVHICSLVAPDSPPDKWQYVYIHSKLMIIDDVFMTLGSANINTRSMMVDSEMNICHENAAISHPLRTRLWNLHTNGLGAQDDVAEAFRKWEHVATRNTELREERNSQPYASLVQFRYESANRSRSD
ncbi:phospholipase D-like domain-containing protein [Herbaspirillum lusitanum]|uniref:Phospholipase D-like domain-containing protein n=1 Tax=Herbaspirillum lusitanum TaxID=213312 RepID=A0ABW9AF36_9BURK